MTRAQSLAPAAIAGQAMPRGRLAIAFGPRFFVLLAMSVLWAGPLLVNLRFAYGLVAWDAIVLAIWALDAWRIPSTRTITATRAWLSAPSLSVKSCVQLTVDNASDRNLVARIVDEIPASLRSEPPSTTLTIAAHDSAQCSYDVQPRTRGSQQVGSIYLQYGTAWRIAERWARVPLQQQVVVYPNIVDAKREALAAVGTRQREARRNPRQRAGAGRVFESLREYQPGDDVRDVCWTATARRAKLVTKNYVIEPNQHIWIVLDTGRLMRTRVKRQDAGAAPDANQDFSMLDLAVNASLALAGVALQSGDRVGLLAYGRSITARVNDVHGAAQLSQLVEPLARVETDMLEADHLAAATFLSSAQKRRSLIVWMTTLPDTAMTPPVVRAVRSLMPRHLVVFAVIGQPDVRRIATEIPATATDMYVGAAAQEMIQRRDMQLARLRSHGALAFEVTSGLSHRVVNAYLDVKERGLL